MRWAKKEGYEVVGEDDEDRDNRFVCYELTTDGLREIFDAGFEAALEHVSKGESD